MFEWFTKEIAAFPTCRGDTFWRTPSAMNWVNLAWDSLSRGGPKILGPLWGAHRPIGKGTLSRKLHGFFQQPCPLRCSAAL